MDRWFIIISTALAIIAGLLRLFSLYRNGRKFVVWPLVVGIFLCQIGYLILRGELRGACPLRGSAEIAIYLSWSLTLFYLLIGRVYRLSLLGFFTMPLVLVLQAYALVPGKLAVSPEFVLDTNPWGETHAATAVLSYGAFALAAIAGVMFLVLDRLLKSQSLSGNLFQNLPPIRELLICIERLFWVGLSLLSIGILAGFLMPQDKAYLSHLIAAVIVWFAYVSVILLMQTRGLSGRKLALGAIALFIISMGVFVAI